jgi:hypothetical protein
MHDLPNVRPAAVRPAAAGGEAAGHAVAAATVGGVGAPGADKDLRIAWRYANLPKQGGAAVPAPAAATAPVANPLAATTNAQHKKEEEAEEEEEEEEGSHRQHLLPQHRFPWASSAR